MRWADTEKVKCDERRTGRSTGDSGEKTLRGEQGHLYRCSAGSRISGWFPSGLCEGAALAQGVGRGKTGEQAGRTSGSGQPGLSAGEPEGLWTGGWYEHTFLRPHPGSSQADTGARREGIVGGPFEPAGSDHREARNRRFRGRRRVAGPASQDSGGHRGCLRRSAAIGR